MTNLAADPTCIFCRIIRREAPARIITETADVIVFLSLENHPLVVPKAHIPNLYTLDAATGAALMKETVHIANAVKKALDCHGIYITQSNEPAAGQDVFHLHIHVYPRWHRGQEPAGVAGEQAEAARQAATLDQIRSVL